MEEYSLFNLSFYIEYSDNHVWKFPFAYNHFHHVYELYYLLENETSFFIDNVSYHIEPGTVIIVPPYKIHTNKPLNDRIRKRFVIYIPESMIKDFLNDEPNLLKRIESKPIKIKLPKRESVSELMFKLLNEYQKKNGSMVLKKSLLGELLVNLWRISTEKEKEVKAKGIGKSTARIQTIANYVSAHYNENISLKTLSEKYFFHSSYISRAFKQQLNISFTDFIKNVRIREAALLLQNSDFSVVQIAEKTGFESSTSLCRAFKSVMGTTPLQYRKAYKNSNS